tara:strand:- start:2460 stop:4190 length:1731 start_codon:yes stop_codon:yes gene_type:complete
MPKSLVGILHYDGAIDLYSHSLKFIAWKLKQNNFEILKIGCNQGLERCTSLNSFNYSDIENIGKRNICNICMNYQKSTNYDHFIDIHKYEKILIKKDFEFLNKIQIELNKRNKARDIISIKYKNYALPKFAFFDFSIKEKVNLDTNLTSDLKEKLILGIKDQIKLLRKFENLKKNFKLNYLIYINGNYSLNTLARTFFSKDGVKCLSIEIQPSSQICFNKVSIVEGASFLHPEYLYKKMSLEESIKNISIKDGRKILKSFGERIIGNEFNAYTSLEKNKSIKEELKDINYFINKFKRIHSYFLSSEDEITAHESCFDINKKIKVRNPNFPKFNSQEDFTEYLIDKANTNKKIGFIIRLHPRMAVNKRQDFESIEHTRYKNLFAKINIPENVFIIYGDCSVSSFYIIAKSSLIIVAWSTIGLESLLLGKQVIVAFPYRAGYPISTLSKQPKNKVDFEIALFKKSLYGLPNDKKLLSWTQHAYDSQYFVTTAPRNTQRFIGRFYELSYKSIELIGLYHLLALIINLLFNNRVKIDHKILYKKNLSKKPFAKQRMIILEKELKKYRKNNLKKVLNYGEK